MEFFCDYMAFKNTVFANLQKLTKLIAEIDHMIDNYNIF